jgi:hypothetical protein
MRDITLKRKGNSFQNLARHPILPTPPRRVEVWFDMVGQVANHLYAGLHRKPKTSTVPVLRSKPRRGRKRAAIKAGLASGKRSFGRSIFSPLGMIATLQVCTLLFLTLRSDTGVLPESLRSVEQAIPTSNLNRQLPSVENYQDSQAFDPTSVATTSSFHLSTWVTPWNTTAVQQTQAKYASFSAFWLTVADDGVHMVPKSSLDAWHSLMQTIPKGDRPTFLTVSGDPDLVYAGIYTEELRRTHIASLLEWVTLNGFDGIDINYEGLGNENRQLFSDFITELTASFHLANKQVAVTVEARLNNQVPMDWPLLSRVADEVRVMVYDYHGRTTATPGPIAALGWLKEVLDYIDQETVSEKVVVGLGNYGYDWIEQVVDGQALYQGSGISFEQALAVAGERGVAIVRATGIDERGYDRGAIPTFTYKDDTGRSHSVWFEDNYSLQAKSTLVAQYPVRGVIFWSVGLGDPTFWNQP